MAFIPIHAKADIAGSKKGKLTPAQAAQLNSWSLASKTGILNCLDKCVASVTSTSGGTATIVFQSGYIVICGRLVQCEAGTIFNLSLPASGTETGKIILKFNLGENGTEEFKITIRTSGDLVQQDLNDNPINGVYEFVLYDYEATSSTVTLTRTDTDYIKDLGEALEDLMNTVDTAISDITGEGMIGSGDAPLEGYNKSNGTIEERLTSLGFREGSINSNVFATPNEIKRQGNYVYCNYSGLMGQPSDGINALNISIPQNFRPSSNISVKIVATIRKRGGTAYLQAVGYATMTIQTNGTISFSDTHAAYLYSSNTEAILLDGGTVVGAEFNCGYAASPIT